LFDFLGLSNSCLFSWGGRIVVYFLGVVE
jgi:hypothetical protein